MRIVFLSDTHELHRQTTVPSGDILIHTGDFSNMSNPVAIRDFNSWLGKLKHQIKIIIAGNHDFNFERQPELYKKLITNAIYLENESLNIAGLKIWASPVTPKFFDWGFGWYAEQRKALWKQIPENLDILLTHGPPLYTLDKNTGGEPVGCGYLAAEIIKKKPKIHAFGHIHESWGKVEKGGTTYINSSQMGFGYNYCNKPIVMDI